MSPVPVTPEAARARAGRKYQQNFARWAVAAAGFSLGEAPTPAVDVPLHPPSEAQALAQGQSAIGWVASWTGVPGTVWGSRQWASLGRQSVPERLVLNTPADVARFCGKESHWNRLTQRLGRLVDHPEPAFERAFADAAVRSAGTLGELLAVDFERLLGVLGWLRSNPDSGLYIRQLPIRGVDSKWVGSHRSLVERLLAGATGASSLGLAAAPDLVRARFLDLGLAPGGLEDVAVPVAALAALELAPRTVYVFENLESVLAMPPMPGTVVIHGSGYAVDRLAQIPWVGAAQIIYWGDLDSHGFAILNRFRASGLAMATALMDLATLDAHADLCVPEPKPAVGVFSFLLPEELDMMAELAARGNVRLEQERLDWGYALSGLQAAASAQPPAVGQMHSETVLGSASLRRHPSGPELP